MSISPQHLDLTVLAATCLHNFLQNYTFAWQPNEQNPLALEAYDLLELLLMPL